MKTPVWDPPDPTLPSLPSTLSLVEKQSIYRLQESPVPSLLYPCLSHVTKRFFVEDGCKTKLSGDETRKNLLMKYLVRERDLKHLSSSPTDGLFTTESQGDPGRGRS